jgi:hypothetical protein
MALFAISRFSTAGPPYFFFMNSNSNTPGTSALPDDGDAVGTIRWYCADGADFGTMVAHLSVEVEDAAPAQSQIATRMVFETSTGTSNDQRVERLRLGVSEAVFNNDSQSVDFRVKSSGNANMLAC